MKLLALIILIGLLRCAGYVGLAALYWGREAACHFYITIALAELFHVLILAWIIAHYAKNPPPPQHL